MVSNKNKLTKYSESLENNDYRSELNLEIEKFIAALKECRKSTREIIGEFHGILNP